jgi:hypothetical protein
LRVHVLWVARARTSKPVTKVVAISDRRPVAIGPVPADWRSSAPRGAAAGADAGRPLGRPAVHQRLVHRHRRHRPGGRRPRRLRSRCPNRLRSRFRGRLRSRCPLVGRGAAWLAAHAYADGGWGDTPDSLSNISTTALAWGALQAAPATPATAIAAQGRHRLADARGRRRRRRIAAARPGRALRHRFAPSRCRSSRRWRSPAACAPAGTSRSCPSSWRRRRTSSSPRCGCRW